MTTIKNLTIVDTHIDNVSIRIECIDTNTQFRFYNLITSYIKVNKIVAILEDNLYNNQNYRIDNLYSEQTTIGKIGRGYYKIDHPFYQQDIWYININLFGLKRYHNKIDTKSESLLWHLIALLNFNNIPHILTQIDIAHDVENSLDNLLVFYNRKSPHTLYYQLGDYDSENKRIQLYDETYEIEKNINSRLKRKRIKSGTLYNKRKKEFEKFNRDIGFELSRFEVTLGKQFFVKNKFCITSFMRILNTYSFVSFDTIEHKQAFINAFNMAKDSRQRNKVITNFNNVMIYFEPNIKYIADFLRKLDTMTFNTKNELVSAPEETYIYAMSKFNRYKNF